ncbi:hypothetical protein V2J09_011717 [Rumex salicifolius]
MLHRAATTAYSWWWASHIRTKQSKWLEQNLVDMEDRVQGMMKIIEQEGDSFAKRAEMYYKKRPELIQSVEDTYRAYRALAERYDHLSKDLQSANRTIATVFPEQIQLSVESDDDNSSSAHGSRNPSPERHFKAGQDPKNFPKAPKFPKLPPQSLKGESIISSRKEQLRRTASNATSVVSAKTSGLTKEEAVKEIDVLQKDILAMQTEKEFLKSSYETGLAKFCEIEGKISELQVRVYNLQDEFGVGTVIEDHEARSLMAATALTSCSEALEKLQGQQERSMEEVKAEYARIKEAQERLESLREQVVKEEPKHEPPEPNRFDLITGNIELEEGLSSESLQQKIRERLNVDCKAALTEPELADKIDELVEKIVVLETTVFTQNGMVKRLRQYIDELLTHIMDLEQNKETIAKDKDKVKRILELEEELNKVKCLNQDLVEQKNNLSAELTEANCNLDHLKEKLKDVKPAEEVADSGVSKEAKSEPEVEVEAEKDVHHKQMDVIYHAVSHHYKQDDEEERQLIKPEGGESAAMETEVKEIEDKDGLNWRKLYKNNIDEREMVLAEEYTVILRDYKDIKFKLSEAEKKNREQVFELASHARELRNTIASRDEEIQLLRRKLEGLEGVPEQNVDLELENSSTQKEKILEQQQEKQQQQEEKQQQQEQQQEDYDDDDERTMSGGQTDSPLPSEFDPDRKPLFHHLYDPKTGIIPRTISVSESTTMNADSQEEPSHPVSGVQWRLRAELNDLLEGNLEFWLRFSTSFHQIQKFQAIAKDLKAELSQLRNPRNQEGSNKYNLQALQSEARPLYKHLRETQTEMTLWLEHSSVFEDELKNRFSSLDNIQEEIIRVLDAGKKAGYSELSDFQAAKFQGEVLNMKQENSKVKQEQQAGIHKVKELKLEIDKALVKLDKDFKLSEKKSYSGLLRSPISKPKIPLHTFLFGMKLKKNKKF